VLNKKVLFHFAVTFCKLTGKTVASSIIQCFSLISPVFVSSHPVSVLGYVKFRISNSMCEVLREVLLKIQVLWDVVPENLTLKMKSLRSLQTSVIIYQFSQHNILRDLCIRFPTNTALLLFAVCRNIPVLNTACLVLVHAETCAVPNSEVRYRVRRDNRGRRNLLLKLANVMAD